MIHIIKNGSFITFDFEDANQDKSTYIVLVDDVEVHLDQLGGISVLLKEKVSFVLDSGDEELIGFIEYGESTWIDDIDVYLMCMFQPQKK